MEYFKSVVHLFVASIFLLQCISLLSQFLYDFDTKDKGVISVVIQNAEMVGMMLLEDDINFVDIKDFKEPTDHWKKNQTNIALIAVFIVIVVFVVHIGACVPT